jgi:hypothetical protein
LKFFEEYEDFWRNSNFYGELEDFWRISRFIFWDFGEYLKNMNISREYWNFGEYLKIFEEYDDKTLEDYEDFEEYQSFMKN